MTLLAMWAGERRLAWIAKALCRSADPDELFVTGAAQKRAAMMCRQCEVVTECLIEALDNQIEFGVWGGMTERQRRKLMRRHPEVTSWSEYIASGQRLR
ncbi:WhiB family transcriptional regulator [Mycolicibacterium moriokaense]|nr:WhiB family transcriptional regulator [Mycolicibacterium moriokaense]